MGPTFATTRARALIASLLVALAATLLAPAPAAADTVDYGAEGAFVSAINSLRASRGLPSLQVDGELTAIARSWATQMANAGHISHNPSFSSQVSQNWQKIGENVGVGPDVAGLHQAFVDSAGHYANLVDPAYTRIGVGVIERAGMLWTSHQFMALFPVGTPAPPPVAGAAPAVASGSSGASAPAAAPPPPAPEPPRTLASLPAVLSGLRRLDRLG